MDFGFPVSGCMDADSHYIANVLVGNDPKDAVIEITLGGFSCDFTSKAVVALTGCDAQFEIDGVRVPMYTAIYVDKGAHLRCGYAKTGCRAYLAVQSGFYLKNVMGSVSTNVKCKIGGYLGRALMKEDLLFFNSTEPNIKRVNNRSVKPRVPNSEHLSEAVLRVILGPQDDYFTEKGINTFLSATYTVANDSDRMGIKTTGESVESKAGVDIISDGMPLGGVQIPASGMPIIMAADRQTTGGYAKIATVISSDMPVVAQLRPGNAIKFEKVSVSEAVKIYKDRKKYLENISKLWKR
jgi:biotin-dependent carboxylase-like uncharacterized protein